MNIDVEAETEIEIQAENETNTEIEAEVKAEIAETAAAVVVAEAQHTIEIEVEADLMNRTFEETFIDVTMSLRTMNHHIHTNLHQEIQAFIPDHVDLDLDLPRDTIPIQSK